MPQIRVVGILRMKDRQAAVDVLNRVCDVASGIQGAEVWEAFADEDSDLVYLNQRFDSEKAYLRYESAVDAEDLRPRVGEALEFEHLLLLSPIEDERLKAGFDAMGAVTIQLVASN